MTTYAELVTQIRDYSETDSAVLTTTIINDIIANAEDKIFRNIELDDFVKLFKFIKKTFTIDEAELVQRVDDYKFNQYFYDYYADIKNMNDEDIKELVVNFKGSINKKGL